ncbi:polysaccharide biosynthesis tyrosine autokinase [Mucilaginibacter gynuensis]|uniref:non-specific protein-tyrosine kinase n=1 Tax=Mucilaginibacter gynuensis TaxID=1302236 RepID=A0ABP8GPS9_9SPHI
MQENVNIQPKLPNQDIDYFKIGRILLSRWYWIAAAVVLFTAASYIYLWYTPKTYATTGTIKLEEKKSEISDLVSVINNADRGPSKIQSETFVIQSRNLLLNAIRDIDYRISFFIAGRVRTSELYPQKPLNIQLLKFDSTAYYHDDINYKPIDRRSFTLNYIINGKEVNKTYAYNSPVTIGNTTFSIAMAAEIDHAAYRFKFNTPEDLLGRVKGGLRISEVIKNSNIISLQQTDSNPQFAADILNAIMNEYLNYDRNQKTQSATQMIHFIDTQLIDLSKGVQGSENKIERYKQNARILDVGSAADQALEKAREVESQRSLLKIELIAIDQLKKHISSEKENVSLNFNLEGSVDPLLNGLITSFNTLLIEKSALLKTYNEASQPVQDVNKQLQMVKKAALDNVYASSIRIQKNLDYLSGQLSQVNRQISELPAAERDLVSMKRDFEINEKVYSFLSEKKLEAQISRSAILPGATIIEPAQTSATPISPNSREIHRTAIILGLLVGIGLIVVIRVLNPYIYDKETVESLTTIPIIGVIRKFPAEIDDFNTQILALSKPRSIFAESVRSVRTNLSFLASEKASKVICITSEVAGEGKSFVAVNLACTLALINKRVILIAADLRRSKLHKTFKAANSKGLSNYLANQCETAEIISPSGYTNVDFITSGPVPPNPSELLHSDRMTALIESLRNSYDIIMIDTAPIGLVSDAIPLVRVSDVNVFVIRSGKSKFYAATVPQRIAQEYSINNTVIVLNAFAEDMLHSRYYTTKFTGGNYGNRYYYYSDYSGYEGSNYYAEGQQGGKWSIKNWFRR